MRDTGARGRNHSFSLFVSVAFFFYCLLISVPLGQSRMGDDHTLGGGLARAKGSSGCISSRVPAFPAATGANIGSERQKREGGRARMSLMRAWEGGVGDSVGAGVSCCWLRVCLVEVA